LAGAERVPKIKLLRVSGYRRDIAIRRPLIRSTTHTPDHPIHRSQFLHWFVDLTAPSIDSLPKARLIFMTFRELFPTAFLQSSRSDYLTGTRCFSSSVQFKKTGRYFDQCFIAAADRDLR
jgi:hypothetical protein